MKKGKIAIDVQFAFKKNDIGDVIETGLRYSSWAEVVDQVGNARYEAWVPLTNGGALFIKDNENGRKYRLDLDTVTRGLMVMAEDYTIDFGSIKAETGDANTADIFLQCALFGKVKYS